jgi:hypothetical protein
VHRQQQRVIFPVIGEELIALFGEMWGGANVNGGEKIAMRLVISRDCCCTRCIIYTFIRPI